MACVKFRWTRASCNGNQWSRNFNLILSITILIIYYSIAHVPLHVPNCNELRVYALHGTAHTRLFRSIQWHVYKYNVWLYNICVKPCSRAVIQSVQVHSKVDELRDCGIIWHTVNKLNLQLTVARLKLSNNFSTGLKSGWGCLTRGYGSFGSRTWSARKVRLLCLSSSTHLWRTWSPLAYPGTSGFAPAGGRRSVLENLLGGLAAIFTKILNSRYLNGFFYRQIVMVKLRLVMNRGNHRKYRYIWYNSTVNNWGQYSSEVRPLPFSSFSPREDFLPFPEHLAVHRITSSRHTCALFTQYQ